MNIKTGEIKAFSSPDELQQAMASGNWLQLGRKPKPSCKKCFGRGHVGRNDAGHYVPCSCVKVTERERQVVMKNETRVGVFSGLGVVALIVFLSGCLMNAGCIMVGHVTNNFPPGRNEAGLGFRATNDVYMYSDTGDTGTQEQSAFGADISITKADAPLPEPKSEAVIVTEKKIGAPPKP